jgi:hypothetical protein
MNESAGCRIADVCAQRPLSTPSQVSQRVSDARVTPTLQFRNVGRRVSRTSGINFVDVVFGLISNDSCCRGGLKIGSRSAPRIQDHVSVTFQSSLRSLSRSKSRRESDGCPMFATADMGRKRWAQPHDRFRHSTSKSCSEGLIAFQAAHQRLKPIHLGCSIYGRKGRDSMLTHPLHPDHNRPILASISDSSSTSGRRSPSHGS